MAGVTLVKATMSLTTMQWAPELQRGQGKHLHRRRNNRLSLARWGAPA